MCLTLKEYDLDLSVLNHEKLRKINNKYSIMDKLLLNEQIDSRLRLLNKEQSLLNATTQPQDKVEGQNESVALPRTGSQQNIFGSPQNLIVVNKGGNINGSIHQ